MQNRNSSEVGISNYKGTYCVTGYVRINICSDKSVVNIYFSPSRVKRHFTIKCTTFIINSFVGVYINVGKLPVIVEKAPTVRIVNGSLVTVMDVSQVTIDNSTLTIDPIFKGEIIAYDCKIRQPMMCIPNIVRKAFADIKFVYI